MKLAAAKTYRESLTPKPLSDGADIGWMERLRLTAYRRFEAAGLPARSQEDWKYISLEPILNGEFSLPSQECLDTADRKMLELYFLSRDEPNRLVFINGIYSKKFSSTAHLPDGACLTDLPTAIRTEEGLLKNYLGRRIDVESNAFALINGFSFTDGAFFYLPPKTSLETPVHLLFVTIETTREPLVFYPRILCVLEEGAKANIVLNHVELTKKSHFMNAVGEFHLGEAAALETLHIQRADGHGFHFSKHNFSLRRKASVRATFFTKGGELARNEAVVDFQGENGSAELKGLSVLGDKSQAFHLPTANHHAPHCTSRQYYKNVLTGAARSEFNSLVYVAKNAVQSDSQQMNRNLLLSEGAQAFSRPQLRILNDDVSCQHGATVGQLEKEELFYLRTRGLTKEQAQSILIYGFAEEIIEEIETESVRAPIEKLVRDEIKKCL